MIDVRMPREELLKTLDKMEDEIVREAPLSFGRWAHWALARFKAERLTGRPGLHPRTGTLRRSFRFAVKGRHFWDTSVEIKSTAKYAAIHEFGGEIRPKRAKKLAIPLADAKTQAGVARWSSPLRVTLAGLNVRCVRTPSGGLFLVSFGGHVPGTAKKAAKWLFVLRDVVRIPARMGLRDSLQKNLGRLVARLSKRFQEIFRRGK